MCGVWNHGSVASVEISSLSVALAGFLAIVFELWR